MRNTEKYKYRLIDLSHHNGTPDFKKIKADGIDGVIIRTGYGRKHPKQKDRQFERNYSEARKAGLLIGAYHYCYAETVEDALKEADFMLELLKEKSFELPVYGDFEEQSELSGQLCTEIVSAFCRRLEQNGAWAGIYSYDSFFKDKLAEDIPERFTVWVARVENVFPKCVERNHIGIWQNSWKGRVNGVKGDVDMNYCYKDFPSAVKKCGLNQFCSVSMPSY